MPPINDLAKARSRPSPNSEITLDCVKVGDPPESLEVDFYMADMADANRLNRNWMVWLTGMEVPGTDMTIDITGGIKLTGQQHKTASHGTWTHEAKVVKKCQCVEDDVSLPASKLVEFSDITLSISENDGSKWGGLTIKTVNVLKINVEGEYRSTGCGVEQFGRGFVVVTNPGQGPSI